MSSAAVRTRIAVRIDLPHEDAYAGEVHIKTLDIDSDTRVRDATESLMRQLGYSHEDTARVGLVFQGVVCDEDKTFADFGPASGRSMRRGASLDENIGLGAASAGKISLHESLSASDGEHSSAGGADDADASISFS